MAIKEGDRLPDATFMTYGPEGPRPITTDEVFKGKRVALLAVPGAFTPTCSAKHLPGFKEKAADLRGKGIDAIACVSVNDVFVMKAWGADQGVGEDIIMLADGNGAFTRDIGLDMDASKFGMGPRSRSTGPPISTSSGGMRMLDCTPSRSSRSGTVRPSTGRFTARPMACSSLCAQT